MKSAAERAQAAETNIEANVRHTPVRRPQQKHGAFHTPPLQVTVRSLAERSAKGPDKMCFRHLRNLRKEWNAKRLGKGAVHCISRAQHPPIALFHR